jgi:hypothetical protein
MLYLSSLQCMIWSSGYLLSVDLLGMVVRLLSGGRLTDSSQLPDKPLTGECIARCQLLG